MNVRRAAAAAAAALSLLLVIVPATSGAQDTTGDDLGNPVAGVSTVAQAGDDPAVTFLQISIPGQPPSLCTGTLVDPEWVLTAAHCVKDVGGEYADDIDLLIGTVDAQQDLFSPGPGVEAWESDGFVVNGDASIGNNNRWFDDLAMVHIPGQSAITPMPLATDIALVEPPNANATIATRFYGFGATSCLSLANCAADGVLRFGESQIYPDSVVDDVLLLTAKELNRNFFLLPQPSIEGAGCFGDSGGPVTAVVNGQRQVIGVNSFVVTLVPGLCVTFPTLTQGPPNPWYAHGAVDLVGTDLGGWVRSIINATATCGGLPAAIVGSSINDVLVGTADANVMAGRGGGDLLIGRGGDDVLCGGKGADTLRGGGGDDHLIGNGGHDDLRGQSGNDTIDGNKGRDDITGAGGSDEIDGGSGNDDIDAGAGHDIVDGGNGDDRIRGAKGSDILRGGDGDDNIGGGKGDDIARGGKGADTINGNSGPDRLFGNAGRDALDGGSGSDTCKGGSGADTEVNC